MQLFPIQPNHLHASVETCEEIFLCLPSATLPVFTLHSFLCWSPFQFSHWPHSAWRHPSGPGPWPACARVHPHYALGPALLMNTLTSQGNKSDPSLCWSIDCYPFMLPPYCIWRLSTTQNIEILDFVDQVLQLKKNLIQKNLKIRMLPRIRWKSWYAKLQQGTV